MLGLEDINPDRLKELTGTGLRAGQEAQGSGSARLPEAVLPGGRPSARRYHEAKE